MALSTPWTVYKNMIHRQSILAQLISIASTGDSSLGSSPACFYLQHSPSFIAASRIAQEIPFNMDIRRGSVAELKAVGQELASVLPEDNRPWYKKTYLFKLNFCLLSLVLFSSANGYDGSMMNGLIALPQWETFMNHPTGAWMGFINAIGWLGSAFMYPVSAWCANKHGRRPGIWLGYAFLIIATVMQTAAQSVSVFVVARLFLGFASAWWSNTVPLLITETAYPAHRGRLTALFNCGWYVGSLVAAWATFGTRNIQSNWAWRIPSLLQAALPVLALPGFILAKESPRWLVSVGRNDQARTVLAQCHAQGDENSPLVRFELTEIENTLRLEKEAHETTSYMDMIRTKGNRRRLLISVTLGIFGQWSGNGVVSYYCKCPPLSYSSCMTVPPQSIDSC
jgi:MFS family permease